MKKITAVVMTVLMLTALFTMFASAGILELNSDTITPGTPVVDGKIDEVYQSGLNVKFGAPSYAGVDITNVADVYAVYDNDYVYVAAYVTDDFLYQCDEDYLNNDAHPSNNDAFEIRIYTEDHMAPFQGTFTDHHLFYVDAQGRRFSSYQETVDGFTGATTVGEGYYIIEVAIPLTSPLQSGELIAFNFQVDDMNADGEFGATGIASNYMNLVEFTVGGGEIPTPSTPAETPDEPVVTPDEPVETPDEPVVTPDEPVVTPDEPVETPDEPVVTPDEPVETPKDDTPKAPQTFDATLVVLAVLALSVVALVTYKKVASK